MKFNLNLSRFLRVSGEISGTISRSDSDSFLDDLTESQRMCISTAKWHYKEGKVVDCLWQMILAHFDHVSTAVKDAHGNPFMTFKTVSENAVNAQNILIPELQKIFLCNNKRKNDLLVFKFGIIFSAALFESRKFVLNDEILKEVLEAQDLPSDTKNQIKKDKAEFLTPLGFSYEIVGLETLWYFPKQQQSIN